MSSSKITALRSADCFPWARRAPIGLPSAGGAYTIKAEDSGMLFIQPGSAADDYALNLPDPATVPAGWSIDVMSDSNNSSHGIVVTTPSGNILYGAGAATSLTSSTRSAHGRIVRRASTGGNAGVAGIFIVGRWGLSPLAAEYQAAALTGRPVCPMDGDEKHIGELILG